MDCRQGLIVNLYYVKFQFWVMGNVPIFFLTILSKVQEESNCMWKVLSLKRQGNMQWLYASNSPIYPCLPHSWGTGILYTIVPGLTEEVPNPCSLKILWIKQVDEKLFTRCCQQVTAHCQILILTGYASSTVSDMSAFAFPRKIQVWKPHALI